MRVPPVVPGRTYRYTCADHHHRRPEHGPGHRHTGAVGGHTVTVTAKDPAKAARLAGELGTYARNPPTNTATGYGDGITLSRVPASPAYSALVNAASSSCLEIYGGGTAAGSASEVRTWNGATSPGSAVVIENCTVASVSLSKPVVPE